MREYLQRIRQEHKLTQKIAAGKLLISQNYLSDIERGIRQKELKLSTLKGFSRIYQVPLHDLIKAEEKFQARRKR